MPAAIRKLIKIGSILPRLSLAADGTRVTGQPSRQSLLLVFSHPGSCPGCAAYLDDIAGSVDELRSWATTLLAVAPGSEGDDHPFPVLRDEGGENRRRLGIGDDEAAVILADQWGEVFEVATSGDGHDLPLPHQLVESAKIVDLSCGECNVPGPEWREDDNS